LVQFEQMALGRANATVTSVAAYAGSAHTPPRLCYHNDGGIDVYSDLGAAEVVTLRLPAENVTAAAKAYFETFIEIDAGVYVRPDTMDVGAEYRSLIGIPGGIDGELFPLIAAGNEHQMRLVPGNGSENDTFATNNVYIMDSTLFPARHAEVCLQFHDDPNAVYSPSYHALSEALQSSGRLFGVGCPKNYICDPPEQRSPADIWL